MPHRILIVDDSADTTDITARMLAARGYVTATAHDGPSALAQIAVDPPSCVLLDIRLPGMSGLDVLQRLRQDPHTAAIPVIFFTSKTDDQDVLDGYREGADYYITKPCTSEQLVYGIRLVLGELADGDPVEPDRA
jgi:CheY-like chemotaxis protein